MEFDLNEYKISEHFASAMINGDYSGLTDAEERELNDWLKSVAEPGAHWHCANSDSEFAQCEITGLLSLCFTTTQYIPKD